MGRLTNRLRDDFAHYKWAYAMAIPMVAFYLVFHYATMGGAIVAFKDFSPRLGIFGSQWAGLTHFQQFFSGYYFGRLVRNTLLISAYTIIFGFPAPILLALLISEIRDGAFKRVTQTVTYLPYFVSLVVICGIVIDLTSTTGVINDLAAGPDASDRSPTSPSRESCRLS